MTSLHFVTATTYDEPDEPVTLTYTDGAEARAAYDVMRDDPLTKHARLYHNPVPNGGVYDGAGAPVPDLEETEPVKPEPVNPDPTKE